MTTTASNPDVTTVSGNRIARSMRWTYGTTLAGLVLQTGIAALIARQLTPEDYGTVAIAASIMRLLQYFADFGLTSVVIQRTDFNETTDAPLLFAIGLCLNLLLLGALFAVTPLLPLLDPDLSKTGISILHALAAISVVASLGQIARGLLARHLRFRTLGLITAGAILVGQGAVTLPLAYLGFGPWALVAGLTAQAMFTSICALTAAPHRLLPKPYGIPRLRALLRHGSGFSILRIMDAAGLHSFPLIVGFLAGVSATGRWDRAWVFVVVPLEMLATEANRVLFAAFSRYGTDETRLRQAWPEVLLLGTALLAPLAAGMSVAADELGAVLLGSRWDGIGSLIGLLALWAFLRAIAQINGSLCEARGHLWVRGLHQFIYLLVLAAALFALHPDSAAGIASILLLLEIAAQLVLIGIVSRSLHLTISSGLRNLLPGLSLSAFVAAAAFLTVEGLRNAGAGPAATLATTIAACALAVTTGILLHPSRTLRSAISRRVLGQILGLSDSGTSPANRLRLYLERASDKS